MNKWAELAILPIAIALVGGFILFELRSKKDPSEILPPDFSSISDVSLKKETFFEFMLPMVRGANASIRKDRQFLLSVDRRIDRLSESEQQRVLELATRYRIKDDVLNNPAAFDELLARVDTIPVSLALAQSANESAWGTARFATTGNNFYGIWCWSENCGLVPEKRDSEKRHEVAVYSTIQQSVDYYMLTLNSHPAYDTLRDIRTEVRDRQLPVKGIDLALGLTQYSERGDAYVQEIREMIEYNDLERFARLEFDH